MKAVPKRKANPSLTIWSSHVLVICAWHKVNTVGLAELMDTTYRKNSMARAYRECLQAGLIVRRALVESDKPRYKLEERGKVLIEHLMKQGLPQAEVSWTFEPEAAADMPVNDEDDSEF